MRLQTKVLRAFPITLVFLALLLPAAAPTVAAAASAEHLVTQIALTPRTPNILKNNQTVAISFNYTTTEAGGVRVFTLPFSGNAPTPHYAVNASPLYPVGSGAGACHFTITSGNATVTRIRFQMWNDSQTTLLYQTFIPISYQFKSAAQIVSRIGLTATPNVLKLGQKVSVSFNYRATTAGGVRIFARPLSGSALTPNYSAHPSPVYRVGSGAGRGWFTINRGAATVTRVRFQMWNASQTRLLFQAVVPVHYQFKLPANIVNSIDLTPSTPNVLQFGENVTLALSYTTNEVGGVRIFARPFSGGALTPNYGGNPSPVYPVGSGDASGYFTITDGAATVNEIRLQMWNADQTILLFETKIPVFYQFR